MREALRRTGLLDQVASGTWTRDGVVHVQSAGAGQQMLEYLGRHVFRIAITNSRLDHFDQGRVTFRFRDRRTRQMTRRTLAATQFLARFLQHVLPRGFAKIRHYGSASPTCRRQLDTARALFPPALDPPPSSTVSRDPVSTANGEPVVIPDADRYPCCHVGRLLVVASHPGDPPASHRTRSFSRLGYALDSGDRKIWCAAS
jgi:hypothetical protein